MAIGRTVLQTERLSLHEIDMSDLPFLEAMLCDRDVMRYWPRPHTPEECPDWIARHQARYKKDGYGYWLTCLRETGEPIGQTGLLHQVVDGQPLLGLGWIVHKPFWRQGYAFEAAEGCVRHAFETLGESKVCALIRPENEPSMALARKLGMSYERMTTYFDFAHAVMVLSRIQN